MINGTHSLVIERLFFYSRILFRRIRRLKRLLAGSPTTYGRPSARRQRLCVNLVWKGGIVHSPSAALHRARCTPTDNALHHRRAWLWLAAARRTVGARRARNRASCLNKRWDSSFQRPPTSAANTHERCGPPEGKFSVLRACVAQLPPVRRRRGQRPWVGLPCRPSQGHERCVTAKGFAALGCAIDDEIKAPSVIRPHARNGCIGEPLLGHHSLFRADRLARDLDPSLANLPLRSDRQGEGGSAAGRGASVPA